MGDDTLILVTAAIDGDSHVLKTFTGTRYEQAAAYADREYKRSGIDTRITAYVTPTHLPSLDGTCPN